MAPKPETPLSRCAELDFGFPPHTSLVVTYICYPELKLSTGAAGLVVQHLSCKTLPETLQKHHGLPEMQLRTITTRVFLVAAIVLSGVSG